MGEKFKRGVSIPVDFIIIFQNIPINPTCATTLTDTGNTKLFTS